MPDGKPYGGDLDQLCINTIRTLSMDAVQKANSGHPGTPMALAPLAYVIWTRHLKHNPADPKWIDRDRFILSAGHASMLLYSMLYLSGYGLELDDLKNFRQWESKTPGHPEYGLTPGVETTTGPLGQGFANGVGMAMAEAHLAALHNTAEHKPIDHWVYAICSDGDLMEGVAAEAASVAGHLKLGKLIYFWDDNKITIEGSTDLAFTEDVLGRFAAYGWHTDNIEDANDLEAIDAAIRRAKDDPRPSMIGIRSVIGFGSPNRAGTEKAHGEALGEEEVKLTKQALGWPTTDTFWVPREALDHMRSQARERGRQAQDEWQRRYDAFLRADPERGRRLDDALNHRLPDGWDAELPTWSKDDKPIATRAASGKALNAIAKKVPWLIGGSADLAGSNNTMIDGGGDFDASNYAARNLHFGVREHSMGSLMNGMTLHGGVRVYGGTFLIFSDYMKPPIRLAALMEQPTLYVFTHDSVGLGEDGPTHQPIEQLASLRAVPGLVDLRPGDANETTEAWRFAMEYTEGPIFFSLTRQALPHLDRTTLAPADGLRKGAYVLAKEEGELRAIVIATGSELSVAMEARDALQAEGIGTRVVSMPSWALFSRQPREYRDEVLPPAVKARVSIEAAAQMGWEQWVGGEGCAIGISHFGASAPAKEIFKQLGISAENVVAKTKGLLGLAGGNGDEAGEDAAGPAKHGTDEK